MTDTPLPAATVVPNDEGISHDPEGERGTAYAAHMASLATRSGSDSHRESGLSVTANGDGTATVEAGLGMLRYEGGVHTYDRGNDSFQSWENPVVFGVDVPQATVEIVDGSSNDVWLWVDLGGGDVEVNLRHGSGVNAPSEPAMQLASITADGTVTPVAPDKPPIKASTVEAQSGKFEESHTGSLSANAVEYDRSEQNPHFERRQPEVSGPPGPFKPYPGISNPILSKEHVTDKTGVKFVADPFIVEEGGTLYIFYEVSADDGRHIGYSYGPDLENLTYGSITHDNNDDNVSNHFAYPHVFKYEGEWFMTPTRGGSSNAFEIYQADSFPDTWSLVETPLTGQDYSDPSLVLWNDTWYLYSYNSDVSPTQIELRYSDTLLNGNWQVHPSSPIFTGETAKKPAGRPIVSKDNIDIPIQRKVNDDNQVDFYRISELTTSTFSAERTSSSPVTGRTYSYENPVDWRADDMHHVDALMPHIGNRDIVIVDGAGPASEWDIGVYTTAEQSLSAFRAKLSSDQSVAGTGSWNTVNFDGRYFDIGMNFDPSNNAYVIPETGFYKFTATVNFATGIGAPFHARSRIYNSTKGATIAFDDVHTAINDSFSLNCSAMAAFEEGDVVVTDVQQSSDNSNTVNSTPQASLFEGRRVW